MGASEGAGAAAGKIYHPSGRSTPVKHEYSYPESLAARGRYEEAVTAYQVAVSEFPEDPEPYIRIARLNRDKLSEYEDAVFWFKRARNDSEIPSGQELLVTQEIIEIYREKLGTPTRAIPELARILDRFPEDQVAGWARGELARLKEQVRAEEEGPAG
jgi:tetratricopeptide (TPR) repeat protein